MKRLLNKEIIGQQMDNNSSKASRGILFLKRHKAYVILACAFLVYFSYSDGIFGDFVFDDIPLIVDDPFYTAEANPLKCWARSFWKESRQQGLYRPMTTFTYWTDIQLFGLKAPLLRAENLLLHLLVCFLVYKYAGRMRLGKTSALLAALLFGLHPIHTEAVIPVFGRGELLCTGFFLLGLLLYSYPGKRYAIFAGGAFLFACWSKEHAVIFIPLCILQDIYLRRIEFKDIKKSLSGVLLTRYSFLLLALFLFFLSRYALLGTMIPALDNFEPGIDNPIATSPFLIRLVSAMRIHGIALSKFIWPDTLSHDYSFAQLMPSVSIWDCNAFMVVLLFIGISALAYIFFPRERRKILFLVLAYLLSILIAGNFIVPAGTIFAERLQYLPSIWLCLFFAMLFMRISRKISFACVLLLLFAVFMACGIRTYVRSADWKNEMSLAVAGIKAAPDSAKMWNNLAVQLENIGDYSGAVAACDMAIKIYPRFSTAYAIRGTNNARLGNSVDAEKDLRQALSLHSRHSKAAHNLGALYANTGRLEEAKRIWEESLKNNPAQRDLRSELEKLEMQMKENGKK